MKKVAGGVLTFGKRFSKLVGSNVATKIKPNTDFYSDISRVFTPARFVATHRNLGALDEDTAILFRLTLTTNSRRRLW